MWCVSEILHLLQGHEQETVSLAKAKCGSSSSSAGWAGLGVLWAPVHRRPVGLQCRRLRRKGAGSLTGGSRSSSM